MSALARLKRLLLGPESNDGVGQSLLDDLRWALRFRRARREAIAWRSPTVAEGAHWDEHPLIGRFGDATSAVAVHDGRRWVVKDRLWFGWPDPPQFVVFAFDGDAIWLGKDFHQWPSAWGLQPGGEL